MKPRKFNKTTIPQNLKSFSKMISDYSHSLYYKMENPFGEITEICNIDL